MRFERLDLTAFGHFTDHALVFGNDTPEHDLHIVYGDNEAGKSTLRAAMVELLYGMPRQSQWNFRHPNDTLELGAILQAEEVGSLRRVEVRRFKNRLTDARGQRLSDQAIDRHGLAREEFIARFSLDDTVLELGSKAILIQEGELGAALFAASSGLADASARIDSVMQSANAFYLPRRKKDLELTALREELDELNRRRLETRREAREWKAFRLSVEAAQQEVKRLIASKADASTTAQRLQRDWHVLPRLARLDLLEESLAALADVPELESSERKQATQWLEQRRSIRSQQQTLQPLLDRYRHQQATQLVDTSVLLQGDDIDSLGRGSELVALLTRQQRDHRQQIEALDIQLRSLAERLDLVAAMPSDLPETTLQRIESLARDKAALDERLTRARAELATAESDVMRFESLAAGTQKHADTDAANESEVRAGGARLDALAQTLGTRLEHMSDTAPLKHLAERQTAFEVASDACRHALDELAPWQGDEQCLHATSVPTPADIDTLQERNTALQTEKRQLDSRLREHKERLVELRNSLAARRETLPVTIESLQSAREQRDDVLGELQSRVQQRVIHTELQQTITRLVGAVRRLDALQDSIALHQGEIATQHLEQRQLEDEQRQYENTRSALEVLEQELEQTRLGLRRLGNGLIDTDDPARLRDWLNKREEALEARTRKIAAETDANRAREAVALATIQLAQALAPCLPGSTSVELSRLPLADLTAIGRRRLQALHEARAQEARRVEQDRQLTLEVDNRRHALEAVLRELRDWESECNRTIAATPLAGTFEKQSFDSIVDRLDTLRELSRCLKERSATSEALVLAEQRLADHAERLRHVQSQLVTDTDELEALPSLAALIERLASARQADGERRQLDQNIKQTADQLDELTQQTLDIDRQLEPIARRLGVDPEIDHWTRLDQAAERDRLHEERQQLTQELTETLAPERLDEVRERLSSGDRDELARLIEQHRLTLDALEADLEAARDRLQRDQARLDDVADDDSVAHLEEQRVNLLARIEAQALDTLALRLGKCTLDAALRRYRDAHRSAMLSAARDAFLRLTRGHYRDLRTQPGKGGSEHLVAVRHDGGTLRADDLSKGTRLQLFLALRIAAWWEYQSQRRPLPFIADDVMESFDEHRASVALQLLHDMSAHGQIIYLTHNRHVVELAEQCFGTGYVLHELPAPTALQ